MRRAAPAACSTAAGRGAPETTEDSMQGNDKMMLTIVITKIITLMIFGGERSLTVTF